jgi:hypothetical protein
MRRVLLAGVLSCLSAAPRARAAELVKPKADRLEKIRALAERLEAGELSGAEKDDLLRSLATELLRSGALQPDPRPSGPAAGSEYFPNKVIAAYADRNATKLVIETREPMVAGTLVYAGPEEVQVTLNDLLSRSRDLYYYSASAPGKARVREGDAVVTGRKRTLETPSALRLKIEETYTFEQKRRGVVTAVQDGRAMIDRGTLHEVRERDIYRVSDASGAYKGFLEIRGIGDLQSSGVLYDRIEDRRKRAGQVAPGDQTLFVGQRKLMALGGLVGFSPRIRREFGYDEKIVGGGLAWDLMFKNGWGLEILFGGYDRTMSSGRLEFDPTFRTDELVKWKVSYIAPIVVKKNFFFPSVVSPFVIAGGSVIDATLRYQLYHKTFAPSSEHLENVRVTRTTFGPLLGAGVDFFPARLIRPRLDFRWQTGPTLHAAHKTLNTETMLLSLSVFSAW